MARCGPWLATAREHWRRDFMLRPGPRLVVCIGGPTRHCRLGGWADSIGNSGDSGGRWWWWWAGLRAWRLLADVTGRRATAAAEEAFAEEVSDFVTLACSDPTPTYNRTRLSGGEDGGCGGGGGVSGSFGSVFVTFSRRTPKSLRAALHRHFALRMVAAHTRGMDSEAGRRTPPRHRHRPPNRGGDFVESQPSTPPSSGVTAAVAMEDSDGHASMLFGPKISSAPSDRSASPIVLPKSPGLWVWDDQGPNPYEGAMAWYGFSKKESASDRAYDRTCLDECIPGMYV